VAGTLSQSGYHFCPGDIADDALRIEGDYRSPVPRSFASLWSQSPLKPLAYLPTFQTSLPRGAFPCAPLEG
jgi:hypothetical protein